MLSASERDRLASDISLFCEGLWNGDKLVFGEWSHESAGGTLLHLQDGEIRADASLLSGSTQQVGQVLIIEARDLNHLIQLLAAHPTLRRGGWFEVRPVNFGQNVGYSKINTSVEIGRDNATNLQKEQL